MIFSFYVFDDDGDDDDDDDDDAKYTYVVL